MRHAIDVMPQSELSRFVPSVDSGFGCLSTERGNLPLTAMDVRARIVGLSSSIELRQTFVNRHDLPIEATYIFPLTDRGAVTRFRMTVGERTVDGVVRERGEARRDYDLAIQQGHRAAITEEERPGLFTLRVGNLMPNDVATIELSISGRVPIEDGDATFRFPLVVAPRYIPGAPLPGDSVGDGVAVDTDAVPDASRITPPVLLAGMPNPVRLSLSLELDPAGLPVSNLRSSLHAAAATAGEGGSQRIELAPGERLDRDFVVRFRLGDDVVRSSLRLSPDATGEGGTFSLTLLPPAAGRGTGRPRDVVFVLDRSGSMPGWKMVAARRAVARMVDTLNDRDRFAVYAFDDYIESPAAFAGSALVAGSDRNRFRAVEFLAGLESRGGTEMAEPLLRGVGELAGGYDDRDRVLVLVTDGQVGNEDQILRGLAEKLRNVRVFTLGIDRAVNEGFLRRLAAAGGGASSIVESEDRLDEVMDRVHRRIATPVVTELTIEPRGLDVERDSIAPARLPDLFEGAPVTIQGRYRGSPNGSVTVRGKDALGSPWEQGVSSGVASDPAAGAVWARAHLRDLEDRYVTAGAGAALADRIIALSCKWQVLCRFTAFIAIDRGAVVNASGDVHKVIQPVEMPSGWAMNEQDAETRAVLGRSVSAAACAPAPMSMQGPVSYDQTPGGQAAPSPAKAKAAIAGVRSAVSRVRQAFTPRQDESRALAPLDLSSYRVRAERALEQARRASDGWFGLRELAVALAALAEDLETIGADARAVSALRALIAEIARWTAGSGSSGPDAAARLVEAGERVDRAFAPLSATPPRGEFWK